MFRSSCDLTHKHAIYKCAHGLFLSLSRSGFIGYGVLHLLPELVFHVNVGKPDLRSDDIGVCPHFFFQCVLGDVHEPRSLDVAHEDLLFESVHSLLCKCCGDIEQTNELFALGELEIRPQSAKVLVPLLLGSPMKYSFAGGISSNFSNS